MTSFHLSSIVNHHTLLFLCRFLASFYFSGILCIINDDDLFPDFYLPGIFYSHTLLFLCWVLFSFYLPSIFYLCPVLPYRGILADFYESGVFTNLVSCGALTCIFCNIFFVWFSEWHSLHSFDLFLALKFVGSFLGNRSWAIIGYRPSFSSTVATLPVD